MVASIALLRHRDMSVTQSWVVSAARRGCAYHNSRAQRSAHHRAPHRNPLTIWWMGGCHAVSHFFCVTIQYSILWRCICHHEVRLEGAPAAAARRTDDLHFAINSNCFLDSEFRETALHQHTDLRNQRLNQKFWLENQIRTGVFPINLHQEKMTSLPQQNVLFI